MKMQLPQIITLKHVSKTLVWVKFALILTITLGVIVSQQSVAQAQRPEPETTNGFAFQLHHVTLSVNNVEQVSQWYVDTLGFTMGDRSTLTRPDGSEVQVVRVAIPGLQMNISKFDGSVSPNRRADEQGWRHLALQVNDVDQTYQQLRAKGVQFLTEPFTYNPPGYRIVFFKDPEGNILELYQEI